MLLKRFGVWALLFARAVSLGARFAIAAHAYPQAKETKRQGPSLTFVAAVATIVALMVLAFAGVGHAADRRPRVVKNVPAGTRKEDWS